MQNITVEIKVTMDGKTFTHRQRLSHHNLASILQGAYKDNHQEPPITLVKLAKVAANDVRTMVEEPLVHAESQHDMRLRMGF